MNFRQLLTFVGIVEEGSFNKAAQRLNATQSGLSMQIRNLEEHLGTELFERSSRGVRPTRAGQRFYDRALAILRQIDDAEMELRNLAGTEGGPLRVGLMPTFTRGLLAPVLEDFLRDHPNVQLTVVEAYSALLTEMVSDGAADFAIVPQAAPVRGLKSTFLGTDREILVCNPHRKQAHLAPVCLAELPPLKLVLPARGNARRDAIEAFIGETGLRVETILDMDAMIATLEFVAVSDYVTILPATVCTRDLDGRMRKLHPIIDPMMTVRYAIVEPAARSLPVMARTFLDLLRREYARSDRQWQKVLAG